MLPSFFIDHMITSETTILLTLTERGKLLPRKKMTLEKQRKMAVKIAKIKKLEEQGKELYPWQKQLLWEWEPKPKYQEVKTKVRYSAEAVQYLAFESLEGCPRGHSRKEFEENKKAFAAMKPEERIRLNLEARYSDYLKVEFDLVN